MLLRPLEERIKECREVDLSQFSNKADKFAVMFDMLFQGYADIEIDIEKHDTVIILDLGENRVTYNMDTRWAECQITERRYKNTLGCQWTMFRHVNEWLLSD